VRSGPGARPITVSKETYNSVKRDLPQSGPGARPITVSKETYDSVKRDLPQSGPGEAMTILLLPMISARPSKQPLVVRTFSQPSSRWNLSKGVYLKDLP